MLQVRFSCPNAHLVTYYEVLFYMSYDLYRPCIIKGNVEDCPCYAGLDEQLFYNAKYEMVPDDYGFSTITGNSHTATTPINVDLKSLEKLC